MSAPEPRPTKPFKLGNILRGYCEGDFPDLDTAWLWLSARFLLSYPTESSRWVQLYVRERNAYGIVEWIICRQDWTPTAEAAKLPRDRVLLAAPNMGPW